MCYSKSLFFTTDNVELKFDAALSTFISTGAFFFIFEISNASWINWKQSEPDGESERAWNSYRWAINSSWSTEEFSWTVTNSIARVGTSAICEKIKNIAETLGELPRLVLKHLPYWCPYFVMWSRLGLSSLLLTQFAEGESPWLGTKPVNLISLEWAACKQIFD